MDRQLLNRLVLYMRRRLPGIHPGEFAGNRGASEGIELANVRERQPHDPANRIHLPVTIATGIEHVWESDPDYSVVAGIVVDLNAGMFASALGDKAMTAARAAVIFGYMGAHRGNRFGAIITSTRESMLQLQPGQGVIHVNKLVKLLADTETQVGEPHLLHHGLSVYPAVFKQRGLCVVVSDFRAPYWQYEMVRLSQLHDVIAIQVVDGRELSLEPGSKHFQWLGPVGAKSGGADGSSRRGREKYAVKGEDFMRRTKDAIARAGASHLVLQTDKVSSDEALVDAIEQFMLSRKRRKGGIYVRSA